MAGWHHRLNGHEFEQASGVGDGQVQFPLTQIYYVHKSLFLFRVPASAVLSESDLPSITYFLLCVL